MNVHGTGERRRRLVPHVEEGGRQFVHVGSARSSLGEGGGEVARASRLTPRHRTNVSGLVGIHLIQGPGVDALLRQERKEGMLPYTATYNTTCSNVLYNAYLKGVCT